MASSGAPIGIIAGAGALPIELANALRAQGRRLVVVAIDAHADTAAFAGDTTIEAGLLEVAKAVRHFRRHGVREVVMAGRVRRPSWRDLRLDRYSIPFMLCHRLLARAGDNRMMRSAVAGFAKLGLAVVPIADLLGQKPFAPGALGCHAPDRGVLKSLPVGVDAALAHGRRDRGHAVVMRGQDIVAIEGPDGTDAMLARTAAADLTQGAVLIKLPKPDQEPRADPPTIGLTTIALAAEVGLAGIVISRVGTLVIETEAVIAAADRAGLFLYAIDPPAHG